MFSDFHALSATLFLAAFTLAQFALCLPSVALVANACYSCDEVSFFFLHSVMSLDIMIHIHPLCICNGYIGGLIHTQQKILPEIIQIFLYDLGFSCHLARDFGTVQLGCTTLCRDMCLNESPQVSYFQEKRELIHTWNAFLKVEARSSFAYIVLSCSLLKLLALGWIGSTYRQRRAMNDKAD